MTAILLGVACVSAACLVVILTALWIEQSLRQYQQGRGLRL